MGCNCAIVRAVDCLIGFFMGCHSCLGQSKCRKHEACTAPTFLKPRIKQGTIAGRTLQFRNDFWIFGFWIFLSFTLKKQLQNWIRKKTAFVSVFTVFLRGVRVAGGVSICIYIYIYLYTYVFCM